MVFGVATIGCFVSPAYGAQRSGETSAQTALSQCVSLRTSGADRILTARWLLVAMSKSPQVADLSTVKTEQAKAINQDFAKLMTRLVTKDCVDEVRAVAVDQNFDDALGAVGQALGETAMTELSNGKEVDQGLKDYAEFLSDDDFKPLIDSLPKKSK